MHHGRLPLQPLQAERADVVDEVLAREETAIICEAGHTTTDWRLTREAVQAVAARAAEAGVDVVPANAEVWVKVRTETGIFPEYEDIA
ncbi:hypothetical protein [Streptomyces sp. NBC_01538]|uniref:hypothetical protein n=1 Tax=Streptomyces sp. NBC_01538 TaxID=2903897 RepID=UPI00386366B3